MSQRGGEVIASIGYDSEADVENPTGSAFCAHGAGFVVPWNEVEDHMHLEYTLENPEEESDSAESAADRAAEHPLCRKQKKHPTACRWQSPAGGKGAGRNLYEDIRQSGSGSAPVSSGGHVRSPRHPASGIPNMQNQTARRSRRRNICWWTAITLFLHGMI